MENEIMEQTEESTFESDAQKTAKNTADGAQTETEKHEASVKRFKTSDELIKAYANLEKEFTKRSQRLKALERENEQNKSVTPPPVYTREDWRKRVDEFIGKNPSAVPFKKQIAEKITDSDLAGNPDCLELAFARVLIENYRAPSVLFDDEAFLNEYVYANEKIKEKIIRDYLCEVKNVRSPKIICGGGQPALTPPDRPKNFDEAGKMALKLSYGGNKK